MIAKEKWIMLVLTAALALFMLPQTSALELKVFSTEKLTVGRPSQVTISITANNSLDGFITVNMTGCNVSEKIFGVLKLEFQNNQSVQSYRKSLGMICNQKTNYSIQIKLFDLKNSLLATASATGYADYSDREPPIIISQVPVGVVRSEFVNVTIRTNEFGICKLDKNNISFSQMSIQLSDVDVMHYTLLDLMPGKYKYYLSCMDAYGNIMTAKTLEFEVNTPPTATIALSDSSPVKAGILEITLDTSKPLNRVPSLSYDLDGAAAKAISVTGSKDHWQGYIVVDDANDQHIATFHFSGTDLQGQTGTTITGGQVFIIDTKKPLAPQALTASSGAAIQLGWYYEGEDVQQFNIYRSLNSPVEVSNYYAKSSSTHYTDYDTSGGQTYYYRVSAVDLAGNEGPLSQEASAFSRKPATKTTETQAQTQTLEKQTVLEDSLAYRVNESLNQLEKVYLDVKWVQNSLSDLTDADLAKAVSDLGLAEEVNGMKLRLDQYRNEMKDLWYTDLSEKDLDKRLNSLVEKIDNLRKTTPESAQITQRAVVTQAFSETALEEVLQEVLLDYNLNSKQLAAYKPANVKLQDDLHVATDVKTVEIKYLDGTKGNTTIVDKDVSYSGAKSAKQVRLVEFVPKQFSRTASEITFLTQGYTIIRDDPVISWQFDDLGSRKNLEYYVRRYVPIEDAKKTETFIILEPGQIPESAEKPINETANAPTAFAVHESASLFTGTETIMIIIGLVFVMGLVVYYFVVSGTSFDDIMAERYMRSYARKAQRMDEKARGLERMQDEYVPMERENQYIYVQILLKKAYDCVESRQINKALTIYDEIQEVYAELGPTHKAEIYDQCLKLFEMLNAVRKS